MSIANEQPSPPSLLGEALLNAIRQAVREEIHALGHHNNGHDDRLLDTEQAAKVLSVSKEWLYRNAKKLPFTRKLGHKMLRFSHLGIQKYLAAKITLQTR